jgi:oligo-1,6-glucosidase
MVERCRDTASFQDSGGDGVGDIPGIISKLEYLRDLGVNVIHYQSLQVDMGYHISDYVNVYYPYGTVDDVQVLLNQTHDTVGLGAECGVRS